MRFDRITGGGFSPLTNNIETAPQRFFHLFFIIFWSVSERIRVRLLITALLIRSGHTVLEAGVVQPIYTR